VCFGSVVYSRQWWPDCLDIAHIRVFILSRAHRWSDLALIIEANLSVLQLRDGSCRPSSGGSRTAFCLAQLIAQSDMVSHRRQTLGIMLKWLDWVKEWLGSVMLSFASEVAILDAIALNP
jgi:hypothetical protein